MVALWIKQRLLLEENADIIISDHTNGGEEISDKLKMSRLFSNVYYAKTLIVARYRYEPSNVKLFLKDLFPSRQLKKYVNIKEKYTDLYLANFDMFSQLLFTAISYHNTNLNLHVFEDGLSTYMEIKQYYEYFKPYYWDNSYSKIKRFIHEKVYRKRPLYSNVYRFLVFNPNVMKWDPGCRIDLLEKININNASFKQLVNKVFALSDSPDRYDRKYIFFEESFFADGESINDVELVERLAKKVGKDNIMIKIHPRNPVNRFAKLGFKTNQDTSIPWEVILMNMNDVADKVFLTVASSAILNPIMIFGSSIHAYSLYNCLSIVPQRLKGESWAFLKSMFEQYPDMIKICESIEEIE